MKVIFVRHGESTANAGIPIFDLSTLELTDTGREQAARVAADWQATPTLIAVSPYLRTHQTAQPTRERFPSVPTRILPMEEFTYLKPSRWIGTSRDEWLPHVEAYWAAADPAYQDGPGAESFNTLLGRVERTLQTLQALPQDALVYAFSHGEFMQAVRVSLLQPAWSSKQKMAHFPHFHAKFPILNCARLEASFDSRRWSTPPVEESTMQSQR
jgi:broad specificity phosphatase PhoE